jgi:hypothetical protein
MLIMLQDKQPNKVTVINSLSNKPAKHISLVGKLQSYLQLKDSKRYGTKADRLIEKYYNMAMSGDPIIMRDLVNRIDGLPKQNIDISADTTASIGILSALFGNSIRKLREGKEYKVLDVEKKENTSTAKQDSPEQV